ncbi:MAG: hypothetical protein WAO91_08805 [Candidatus Nitrosotenuis sp.]
MISKSQKQMFENSIMSFLESCGPPILNWLLDIDEKYQSNLLSSENILKKFWDVFVRNGPHSDRIFQYLATKTPKQLSQIIIELFSDLISTKDQTKYSTLLKTFSENYSSWPNDLVTHIQDICLKVANDMNFPDNSLLYQTVLATLEKLSDEQFSTISKIVLQNITNENPIVRNNTIEFLETINKKRILEEPFGIKECFEHVETLLNNNDVNVKPLLDYVFRHLNNLTDKQQTKLTNLIKEQLDLNKPNPMRLLSLEFISTLVTEINRKNILNSVIELARVAQENDTKEKCKKILKELRKHLTSTKENEVKEIFPDIGFD